MSLNSVMEILKQKHDPEDYTADQAARAETHKERLSFIEGFKAALAEQEAKKGKPFFVSDPNDPKGFRPNK